MCIVHAETFKLIVPEKGSTFVAGDRPIMETKLSCWPAHEALNLCLHTVKIILISLFYRRRLFDKQTTNFD